VNVLLTITFFKTVAWNFFHAVLFILKNSLNITGNTIFSYLSKKSLVLLSLQSTDAWLVAFCVAGTSRLVTTTPRPFLLIDRSDKSSLSSRISISFSLCVTSGLHLFKKNLVIFIGRRDLFFLFKKGCFITNFFILKRTFRLSYLKIIYKGLFIL
jgi:hypothetical protein